MPFHKSRLIAPALFAGLIAIPGTALAQTEEPETPPAAQDQTEQQTQGETPGQAEQQAQEETPGDTEQQAQEETPGETEAATPTTEQLESFAAATIDIVEIQETAQEQMEIAVKDAGLTVEEYNQIARAAQTDPEVDLALKRLIQERVVE